MGGTWDHGSIYILPRNCVSTGVPHGCVLGPHLFVIYFLHFVKILCQFEICKSNFLALWVTPSCIAPAASKPPPSLICLL